jgi:hypothetical protein
VVDGFTRESATVARCGPAHPRAHESGVDVNDQLLLAGLLCALALNAITAWIRLARAPCAPHVAAWALPWWTLSAIFQTLATVPSIEEPESCG